MSRRFLQGFEVRATGLIILKVVDLATNLVKGAEVIIDAAQMPFAPDGPSGVAVAAISELHYLASIQIEAVELNPAGALTVKHEVFVVAGD